jgi:hypothetical protein
LEDHALDLLKVRIVRVVELGLGSGRYAAECMCDLWYLMGECVHSELVKDNIKKVEERVECYEDREERRQDREERVFKEKKKKEKKERKRKRKEEKKAKKRMEKETLKK